MFVNLDTKASTYDKTQVISKTLWSKIALLTTKLYLQYDQMKMVKVQMLLKECDHNVDFNNGYYSIM